MASVSDFTAEELAGFFDYLDELRESGEINMFGAGSCLRDEYLLSTNDSRAVLTAWMGTFDGDSAADVRAAKALSESASA